MRYERFVAQRFLPKDRVSYSGSVVRIATTSIALGVLVMIAAICILRGFQGEIRQKVVGFGSHIVVHSFQTGNTYEVASPVSMERPEVNRIAQVDGVRHVQFYATKGGMIKTSDQIHGILMKGVDREFDTTFFARYLTEGRMCDLNGENPSNEILVSQRIADKLEIGLGDKVRTYFWQDNNYRARAFEVVGIYRTDLTDFDEHYLIGDLRQLQRLNGWDSTLVDGYEVLVEDFSQLDKVAEAVLNQISYDLTLETIVQRNAALFSWLALLDNNIVLIIIIMTLVCTVSILSALLIMIFEKTSTIGVLKTLGAQNGNIRNIFLYKSAGIIARGIAIGNAVALAVCGLQARFQWVRLDSDSYSMEAVPIDLNPWIFILVSVGTLAVCLLALLIPTAYISHIEPAKTVRFE